MRADRQTKRAASRWKTALFLQKREVLLAGAGGALLLLNLDGSVAVLVGLLEQRLLLGRVLLEVRLHAEQQILVGERLGIVRLQLDGFVDRPRCRPGTNLILSASDVVKSR